MASGPGTRYRVGMRRKLIAGAAVLGVLLLGGVYWEYRAAMRAMQALAAQAPQSPTGWVTEPVLDRVPASADAPARVIAKAENWFDDTDAPIRLEAESTPGGAASEVSVMLIRVDTDVAWEPTQRFQLLADGEAVKVFFSEEQGAVYTPRVLRGGALFEEYLYGKVSAADLKRFAKASSARVQVGEQTFDMSPESQAVFAALLE